jgi:pseudouridine-5'-phosphate glycosidase
LRVDSVIEIARLLELKWSLGLEGGAVVSNPVSAADEIPHDEMAAYIETAVREAAARGIAGKAVTPHILARLVEITNGRSLRANIALVQSNARLAAELAAALTS